ncbi:Transcriptional regulatory protein DcuR [compost metagenome]
MHTENLSQEQLDKLLRYSLGAEEDPSPALTIPKGLAESTLVNIWNTIIQLKSPIFSTEDISSQTPISRISIRKYLAFLTDAGILEMELSYGSIGRPVYKYSVTPEGYLNISKYI